MTQSCFDLMRTIAASPAPGTRLCALINLGVHDRRLIAVARIPTEGAPAPTEGL